MKLSNGHTFIKTSALLDCGSDTNISRKDFAQWLNLKGKQRKLSVDSALSKSHDIDSATCRLMSVQHLYQAAQKCLLG